MSLGYLSLWSYFEDFPLGRLPIHVIHVIHFIMKDDQTLPELHQPHLGYLIGRVLTRWDIRIPHFHFVACLTGSTKTRQHAFCPKKLNRCHRFCETQFSTTLFKIKMKKNLDLSYRRCYDNMSTKRQGAMSERPTNKQTTNLHVCLFCFGAN